jgi:NAD-dependent dihydropyrimidine dehydrogenase PreA subunit
LPKVIVDWEKCIGAEVCVQICPMNVYEMKYMPKFDEEKGVPVRMDDCIMCWACVNSCPEGAITVEE